MIVDNLGLTTTDDSAIILPEIAFTLPAPNVVAVNTPEDVIVPIPPVTVQVGVKDTISPDESRPVAVNAWLSPVARDFEVGEIEMVARGLTTELGLEQP